MQMSTAFNIMLGMQCHVSYYSMHILFKAPIQHIEKFIVQISNNLNKQNFFYR